MHLNGFYTILQSHDRTMAAFSSSSSAPLYKAWVRRSDDNSPQAYVRISHHIATTNGVLKSKNVKEFDLSMLRAYAELLYDHLPMPENLTT